MSHSNYDVDDDDLAGLSEEQLAELADFIDPENELLPASDRVVGQTSRKPTGSYDRRHLMDHLKTVAAESTIGEDYVPFIKKAPPKKTQEVPVKKAAEPKTEFDEMLGILDSEDLAELASELGIHGLLDQAGSRGDEPVPATSQTGLHKPGSLYSHIPMAQRSESDGPPQDTDIEESILALEQDSPYLRELNLNNHDLIDADIVDRVIVALRDNTQLVQLNMTNCKLSEGHAQALAENVLSRNTTLVVLNLESNRITPKGIKFIMKAIGENKKTAVRELRMANQYFPGGARAESDIAKYLEMNTSIQKLGYSFSVPSYRTRIDRYIMRNMDRARQRRASQTV